MFNKIYKLIIIVISLSVLIPLVTFAQVTKPSQGGTGISTSTADEIGKCLQVSAVPLAWIKSPCGVSFLTQSGVNIFLNTGSNLQAPTLEATSTTASSTFPLIMGGDISANNIYAKTSAGVDLHSSSGALISNFGAGGSTNTTFTGGVIFPLGIWSSTGNVGIGTTTPSQKFQVSGQSALPAKSSSTQTGIMRLVPNGTAAANNSALDFGVYNTTGAGWIQSGNLTALGTNYALLLNPNGGNIGIGTSTPFAKIDIFNTTSSAITPLFSIASSTNGAGTSTPFIVTANGRVGIGSTTPFGMLDVVGTTTIKGNLLVTRTGEVPTYNDNNLSLMDIVDNINSYTFIGLQNKSNGISASADFVWGNDRTTTATNYFDCGVTSSTYADPIFSLFAPNDGYCFSTDAGLNLGTGTTTAAGVIKFFTGGYAAANEKARITQAGNLGIGTTSPFATLAVNPIAGAALNKFVVGSSTGTSLIVNNTGLVGIGTSTPDHALDIQSNSNLKLKIAGTGNDFIRIDRTDSNQWYIGNISGGLAFETSSLSGGTSKLFISTAGRVGIGTSSPAGVLNPVSTAVITNNSGHAIMAGSVTVGAKTVNIGYDNTSDVGYVQSYSTITGTKNLTINPRGGNVGIGTTSPAARLDIFNTVSSATAPLLSIASSTSGAGTTTAFEIEANGNIGVGTSTPQNKFSIVGNTDNLAVGPLVLNSVGTGNVGTAITLNAVSNAGGHKYSFISTGTSADTGAGAFAVYDGTLDFYRLVIGATGNVGVGTTTPSQKFQVSGQSALPASSGSTQTGIMRLSANGVTPALTATMDFGVLNTTGAGWIQSGSIANLATNYSLLLNPNGGNVGIGTTTPNGKLNVWTGQAGAYTPNTSADDLVIENSASAGLSIVTPDVSTGSIYFGSPSRTIGGILRWNYSGNLFTLGTGNTAGQVSILSGNSVEAMRIDGNGLIGIGTTTPGSRLSVFGTITSTSTPPVISSCGTSPTVVGNSNWGEVTTGATATGCTVTFATKFPTFASCTITNQSMSVVNAMTYTVSNTAFVVTQTGLGGSKINYKCDGI